MGAPPITERHRHHFHRRSPWLEPVRVATTGNLAISTGLNAGDAVDGVTLAAGDRVLVRAQTAPAENGIYVAGTTPDRAYDQSTDDPGWGFLVHVLEGSTYGGTVWRNTNTAAPTVGSTSIAFAQFGLGVTDHGALTGLGDDDHAQYLKEKASGGLASEVPEHSHAGSSTGGTLDAGYATDSEVAAAVAAHEADGSAVHPASAVSVADVAGAYDGTDVEAVLAEIAAGSVRWEVLMADGVTPPEPLTNEDETDWLYGPAVD